MNGPSTSEIPNREELLRQLREMSKEMKPKKDSSTLKLKLEYCGEKRCISMNRPVLLGPLEASIWKLFERKMNIYYMQGRAEVLVAIRTQEDLDGAVKMVDRSGKTSLRLLLSKHEASGEGAFTMQPDSSGVYSNVITEVPYSETCSSCGVGRLSLARSIAGSSCSSGVIMDSEESRFSAPSPRAPTNWRKGRKIGSGSFGSVYVAHDVETGRDVALKWIPLIAKNREASKEARGLENDVGILARLQHPRILQYLGVQNTSDAVLIFMEYMPGGSVKDLIKVEGRLSSNVSRRYVGQVLEGLAFLHKTQIVHRDIKPANILRDLDGNVKIADFGSGKKLQQLASQSGEFVGTVHYTAPEVLRGLSAHGRKADVWSVGVSLVEMLTGHVPWNELEPMAATLVIAFEEPEIEYPPDVDPKMLALAQALLTRDANLRPMAEEVLLNYLR